MNVMPGHAITSTVFGKKASGAKNNDSDDEVVEVGRSAQVLCLALASAAERHPAQHHPVLVGNSEELMCVGHTGFHSLIDWPHSREDCGVHPFGETPHSRSCLQCWCMVCDVLASDCTLWFQHCEAIYSDPHWRACRDRAKNGDRQEVYAQSATTVLTRQTARKVAEPSSAVAPVAPCDIRQTTFSVLVTFWLITFLFTINFWLITFLLTGLTSKQNDS